MSPARRTPSDLQVLVIGGGIAGLATAVALGRQGIVCEVIEPGRSAIGAAISFSGSQPLAALAELGVLDKCLEQGRPMRDTQLRWFDDRGEVVHAVGSPGLSDTPRGVGIYRPVLLAILANAARELGVNIQDGPSLGSLRNEAGRAIATFSDSTERAYDLVVGADGIKSTVRTLVMPEAPTPSSTGQGSIRWMAPGPPIDGPGSFYTSSKCLLASYGLPQHLTYVATTFAVAANTWLSMEDAHQLLAEQLASFSAPYVVALSERLQPDAEVIYRPFDSVLVGDPWYRGRVLLIGDAAHATTAHMAYGGALALEDGVVLGRCVASVTSVEEALERFMRQRFERVARVVETSIRVSQMEQEHVDPGAIAQIRVPAIMALEQPY